jgi:hypothetical protein
LANVWTHPNTSFPTPFSRSLFLFSPPRVIAWRLCVGTKLGCSGAAHWVVDQPDQKTHEYVFFGGFNHLNVFELGRYDLVPSIHVLSHAVRHSRTNMRSRTNRKRVTASRTTTTRRAR